MSLRGIAAALLLEWAATRQRSKESKRWQRCACGVLRCRADPRTTRVNGEDHEARLFGNHGPLYDLVCRSCRSCGAVYGLARPQDDSLPEQEKTCGMRPGLNPEGTPCTFEMGHRGECSWDLTR